MVAFWVHLLYIEVTQCHCPLESQLLTVASFSKPVKYSRQCSSSYTQRPRSSFLKAMCTFGLSQSLLGKCYSTRGERERVGHFLSKFVLIFKFSHLSVHPLVQGPFHSPTYLCILQNLGGWVGPSRHENLCLTISTRLLLFHIGWPPQCNKL